MRLLRQPVRGQLARLGAQAITHRRRLRHERLVAGGRRGGARPGAGGQQRPGVAGAVPHVKTVQSVLDRGQGLGQPALCHPQLCFQPDHRQMVLVLVPDVIEHGPDQGGEFGRSGQVAAGQGDVAGQPPHAGPVQQGREEPKRALDDLAGLVPPAQRHQRLGHVTGQDRAIGPGEPVFPGGRQSLAGYLGGQFMQARAFQHVRLGDGGSQQRLVGLRPGGDRPGLGQRARIRSTFPPAGSAQARVIERGRFGGGITDLPRGGHRFLGDRPQFGVVPAAMHVQGVVGQRFEHPGPRRAGRFGRDQPDRFVQVIGVIGRVRGGTSDGHASAAGARPGPVRRRHRSPAARPWPA